MILLTLVVGLLCGQTLLARNDASDPAKSLDGVWQLASAELGGVKLPDAFAKSTTLTLSPGKYIVSTTEGKDIGTVKLVDGVDGKLAMDVTGTEGPNTGHTFPAIYELKGETLTICYDLSNTARPTEFKTTAGTKLFLAVYQKVKS